MTTVAWDGKSLVSESRAISSFIHQIDDPKLYRVRGHLIGLCGTAEKAMAFLRWFKAGARGNAPVMDDCVAIVITPKGEAMRYEGSQPYPCGVPHAIGSGCEIAMGAMMAGADAKRAVEIACKLDQNSGGKLQCLRLRK